MNENSSSTEYVVIWIQVDVVEGGIELYDSVVEVSMLWSSSSSFEMVVETARNDDARKSKIADDNFLGLK
jgi:hypothetical protein